MGERNDGWVLMKLILYLIFIYPIQYLIGYTIASIEFIVNHSHDFRNLKEYMEFDKDVNAS